MLVALQFAAFAALLVTVLADYWDSGRREDFVAIFVVVLAQVLALVGFSIVGLYIIVLP